MKYIFSFTWLKHWNSFESETQRLIFFAILIGIFLLILFYVIIPTIKFIYKFSFNSEFNKEIQSNWKDLFSSLKPETIKNYISGNLPKSEKNSFIGKWIVYFILYAALMRVLSIGTHSIVFILVFGMLLVGFITSWLKNKNIKLKFPNKEHKNNFEKNVEDRLSKLKDLLDRGVIDRQEYEKQREKIIGDV